jgi:hypothetical protein
MAHAGAGAHAGRGSGRWTAARLGYSVSTTVSLFALDDQTATVSIISAVNAGIGTPSSSTFTSTDPTLTVAPSSSTYTVNQNDGSLSIGLVGTQTGAGDRPVLASFVPKYPTAGEEKCHLSLPSINYQRLHSDRTNTTSGFPLEIPWFLNASAT